MTEDDLIRKYFHKGRQEGLNEGFKAGAILVFLFLVAPLFSAYLDQPFWLVFGISVIISVIAWRFFP